MSNALIERRSLNVDNYSDLWPRFQSVWSAVREALANPSLDIYRDVKTIDWEGIDLGIHDRNATVTGRVGNIDLDIHVEGSNVDCQPTIGLTEDGQMIFTSQEKGEMAMEVKFAFIKSGLDGMLRVKTVNGEIEQGAFWLSAPGNIYRLEQVFLKSGVVLDADTLEDHPHLPNIACVPDPNVRDQIQFDKTIPKKIN